MAEAALLLTSVGSADAAAALGRRLVDARLAACASVLPGVRSIYRWRGEVADETEALLLLKTVAARVAELRAAILEQHPYEVPEVLVLDAREVPPAYLAWLEAETTVS